MNEAKIIFDYLKLTEEIESLDETDEEKKIEMQVCRDCIEVQRGNHSRRFETVEGAAGYVFGMLDQEMYSD